MKNKKFPLTEVVLILVIVILEMLYIRYSWVQSRDGQSENLLLVSKSIVSVLPMDVLKSLDAQPEDIDKPQYKVLKDILKGIIKVNTKARFAYILKERDGKLFFYADSEPEDSKDISPPGQELSEATMDDFKPFQNGKEIFTAASTDRWGTWKTVYIPIKDPLTGKVFASFGMDFDAKVWTNNLLLDVFESSLITLLLLLAVLFSYLLRTKNKVLRVEIETRRKAEEALHNSENQKVAILRAIPDMLFTFNENGDYLEIYSEDDSRLLINRERAIGKNIIDLFPDEIAVMALGAFRKSIESKELVKFSYTINSADKTEYFEARVVPAPDNKVLAIVRDITDLKMAEKELKKQSDDVKKLNSFFVDREIKMIELKKEINQLLAKQGDEPRYNVMD